MPHDTTDLDGNIDYWEETITSISVRRGSEELEGEMDLDDSMVYHKRRHQYACYGEEGQGDGRVLGMEDVGLRGRRLCVRSDRSVSRNRDRLRPGRRRRFASEYVYLHRLRERSQPLHLFQPRPERSDPPRRRPDPLLPPPGLRHGAGLCGAGRGRFGRGGGFQQLGRRVGGVGHSGRLDDG